MVAGWKSHLFPRLECRRRSVHLWDQHCWKHPVQRQILQNYSYGRLIVYLCPEMQAVAKMADLTKFCQLTWRFLCKLHWQRWAWLVGIFGDFYANYMLANLRTTRDGSNVLANTANLAIFMQITSSEMGLTCWRIWRFWRFLCKLHGQRWAWRVGEFGDFGDFYANYMGLMCWRNLPISLWQPNIIA